MYLQHLLISYLLNTKFNIHATLHPSKHNIVTLADVCLCYACYRRLFALCMIPTSVCVVGVLAEIARHRRALRTILHNFSSLVTHLEHMAVGSGNSNEEKSRARGLLNKVASCRFVFWLMDLLSVITKCIKARQINNTGNSNCHRRLH